MKVYIKKVNQKYWTQESLVLGCSTSMKILFHTFFLPCCLPVAIWFFFCPTPGFFKVTRRKGTFFSFCVSCQIFKRKKRQVSKVDTLIRHFHPKVAFLKIIRFYLNLKICNIDMFLWLSNSLEILHYLILLGIRYFGTVLPVSPGGPPNDILGARLLES